MDTQTAAPSSPSTETNSAPAAEAGAKETTKGKKAAAVASDAAGAETGAEGKDAGADTGAAKDPAAVGEVDYTFKPSEALAPFLGADDPVIKAVQDVAKELGLDAAGFEQAQTLVNGLAAKLAEQGVLVQPYNFEAEIGAPGSDGEKDFNAMIAHIEAGKVRGDFTEAEAAELAGMAATGAGLSALKKLRAQVSVDTVANEGEGATLTADQEASEIFKDPRWDKDRIWTAEKRNRLRELYPDQQV